METSERRRNFGYLCKIFAIRRENKAFADDSLKFEAGARYPLHNHPAGEEVFVLEGDIHLGKDHLFAGDYLYRAEQTACGSNVITHQSC